MKMYGFFGHYVDTTCTDETTRKVRKEGMNKLLARKIADLNWEVCVNMRFV
ncbi:unnamed protein product [Ixodes persulcatus]